MKLRHEWGTQSMGWLWISFAAAVGPVGFDFDGAGVAGGVVVEAAPSVVFGFGDEAAGNGVAVDVADFLYKFPCGEDVEVVVAGLPEVLAGAFEEFRGFSFDDAERRGESVVRWLAEEEVDVLGHEDVGVEGEVMGSASLLDDLFEEGF